MSEVKWMVGVEDAQAASRCVSGSKLPLPAFDLTALGKDSRARRMGVWLTNRTLLCYFWAARKIWPFPRLLKFWSVVCVTRAADVKEVLCRTQDFGVPYGPEMTELAGGANFVLGLDGADHTLQRDIIARALRRNGDVEWLGENSRRLAEALIEASGGTIDVIGDLVMRVAAETCARYFGLEIQDPDDFAEWAMSLSALLFADPGGDPATRALALNGATRLRSVIDRAIAKCKAQARPSHDSFTLVDRLVALQSARGAGFSDAELRAILVGMVVGFVPTTTLAAARMLEELLRRPEAMTRAMNAAASKDKLTLEAVLWEAARLNPALQPGQWRIALRDADIGKGFWRKRIRKGTVLMVATQSALRDDALYDRPNRFETDRAPVLDWRNAADWRREDFIFGEGPHACMGTHLAMAQITEMFSALFAQSNLRPARGAAGGIAWIGPLPRRLDMVFDNAKAPAAQSMITVFAPVTGHVSVEELNRRIGEFGNPASANSAIGEALAKTGVVHFASMAAVDAGQPDKPLPSLLLELNVDGDADAALELIAYHAGGFLSPIFKEAIPGPDPLDVILKRCTLRLRAHPWHPWGAIGLDFNGTPESPVAHIEKQERLATFCREAVDHYLRARGHVAESPWAVLEHIRRLINHNDEVARKGQEPAEVGPDGQARELTALRNKGAEFADFLIWPSNRRLQFAAWADPGPWTPIQQIQDFFQSSHAGRLALRGVVGFTFVVAAGVLFYLAALWAKLTGWGSALANSGFGAIIAIATAVVWVALLLAVAIGVFVSILRKGEQSDKDDDETPSLATVLNSEKSENPHGYAQNHFMAVTQLKPGLFRKVTLALALFVVQLAVNSSFRKGYVLNIGTIHYAKWFRPPGGRNLIFLADYDGSWESYLEDFIMRAHTGQTAVWSNGVGFPKTEFLIKDGAQDGDRFKRWVRRQQQIAPFWYSRFPRLTTSQIRNNALIHYGLARARNAVAARAWLKCFGTMQRPDDSIEFEEVQSLAFTGFTDLPYAACAIVKVPDTAAGRSEWLRAVMSKTAPSICFGDARSAANTDQAVAILAFSSLGLAKYGVPPADGMDGLATFPGAFNMGMYKRRKALGDPEQVEWEWSDADAEAAIFVYAKSASERREGMLELLTLLERHRGEKIRTLFTDPVESEDAGAYPREHFGFRDGISQPIIKGTRRSSMRVPARDLVAAGEFIFGYANNLGYYPPSPTVRAESDPGQTLSIPMPKVAGADASTSRFPDFDALDLPDVPRDFGRNGTFLVIRQLAQDVDAFRKFTHDKAEEIKNEYPELIASIGASVDDEWVAAKMMGRWPDGRPLVDRSGNRTAAVHAADGPCGAGGVHARGNRRPDNDFAYGTDDPVGLRCPLGAHMRRVNPRDSLQPGDPLEQSITNRHRLLRRGRSYVVEEKQNVERGLLFVALCGDLERQFEFVQQSWIASPSFHGLRNEPDPVTGPTPCTVDQVFTIPTPSGPMAIHGMRNFVSVKAGGYFFLPGRSALNYLIELGSR